jgi:hypothetical protein
MAPVDSHARSSMSGRRRAGDLEREGVKGGRAAAPSRMGGPSLSRPLAPRGSSPRRGTAAQTLHCGGDGGGARGHGE